MDNVKRFIVTVEKEILVTLDMDKYKGDALQQYIEYNCYNPDDDIKLILRDTADRLALEHVHNGCTDDIEGLISNGHKTEHLDTWVNVKEI